MLRAPLIGHEVVPMGESSQKRLLAPVGMMEALHHEELPVNRVMRLIQEGAGHRPLGVCEDRLPAGFLLLKPAPYTLAIGDPCCGGDVVGKVA
jgi:hypothetical protein